jgi:hypothetical protein
LPARARRTRCSSRPRAQRRSRGALGLGGATWAEAAAEREAQLETSLVASGAGELSVRRTLARTLAVGLGTLAVSYFAGRALF